MSTDEGAPLIPRHPLSALWGDLPEAEFQELAASMLESGHVPTVWMLDGSVLDGWHRYRAALQNGTEVHAPDYMGDDPAGFVIQRNALRRHLTPGQRASAIAACVEWRGPGEYQREESRVAPDSEGWENADESNRSSGSVYPDHLPTRSEIASTAGVSEATIGRAKRAEEAGLGEYIRSGAISVRGADMIVSAGLETAVAAGTITPQDAVKAAKADLAKPPKSKTKTKAKPSKAAARVAELEGQCDALSEDLENAHAEVESLEGIRDDLQSNLAQARGQLRESELEHSPLPEDRQEILDGYREKIEARDERIRVLESSVQDWQTRYNDELRISRGLKARLKELEGEAE